MNNDYNYSFSNESDAKNNFEIQSTPPIPKKGYDAFAITSMILGIAGVVLCCCCCGCFWFLTGILGVAAIVFAVVSRVRLGEFQGMAIAGLVLGIIAVILFLIIFAFVMWIISIPPEEWEMALRDFLQEDYDAFMAEFGDTFYDQYGKSE